MISQFEYRDSKAGKWRFEQVELGKINLIVGASGSGKTRFLNTLFNISTFMATGQPFISGIWKMKIHTDNRDYEFNYSGAQDEDDIFQKPIISSEILTVNNGEKYLTIVERTREHFIFKDQKQAKFDLSRSCITLLSDDEVINPLYNAFSHGMRRNFHESALEQSVKKQSIPIQLEQLLQKDPILEHMWAFESTVNSKLYLFEKYFGHLYDLVKKLFSNIFTSVKDFKIEEANNLGVPVPLFLVKEKGVKEWIPLHELSSGMQKVILIICDVLSLPGDCVYIIDEYENSLGVNSIDFLPELLLEYGGDNQFLITTHHPHLINSMPMKNWLVFNRQGSKVSIKSGRDLEEKYGKSKQKAFIQLINDSFYNKIA